MSKIKYGSGYGATDAEIKKGFKTAEKNQSEWDDNPYPEVMIEEDNSGFLGRRTGFATERI